MPENTNIHTGITIGPILDTMDLTSKPAGLWAASYLFSWITRELLTELCRDGIDRCNFIVPAFSYEGGTVKLTEDTDTDTPLKAMQDKGVGFFHDRIIIRGDYLDSVGKAIDSVTKTLAGHLNADPQWIKQYLQIYALSQEVPQGENPILSLGPLLDTLELEPQYVPMSKDRENPLFSLFGGAEDKSNDGVKNSFLLKGIKEDWMLWADNKRNIIRDISNIARGGLSDVERKWQQYYAVFQSDGDSMTRILKDLTEPAEIQKFSRNCLSFCGEASDRILRYGGIPIYAGGDDLLALLPMMGHNPENETSYSIFALIDDLRGLFYGFFHDAEKEASPTLSAGVSVQFEKSPLYEALERARTMLFSHAKNAEGKNTLSLNLQKHSGQSILFEVNRMDEDGGKILRELNDLLSKLTQNMEEYLSGAGHQMERFHTLFVHAVKMPGEEGKKALENLFDNLFDNEGQKEFQNYLHDLETLSWKIVENTRQTFYKKGTDDAWAETAVSRIESVIRLLHFMLET